MADEKSNPLTDAMVIKIAMMAETLYISVRSRVIGRVSFEALSEKKPILFFPRWQSSRIKSLMEYLIRILYLPEGGTRINNDDDTASLRSSLTRVKGGSCENEFNTRGYE